MLPLFCAFISNQALAGREPKRDLHMQLMVKLTKKCVSHLDTRNVKQPIKFVLENKKLTLSMLWTMNQKGLLLILIFFPL